LQQIPYGLPAAAVRAALNLIDLRAACAQQLDQRSSRRDRNARSPTPFFNRGEQIEQAPLRTTKGAELVEKKNIHLRRTASASTHM
jgi:hypothetical protein